MKYYVPMIAGAVAVLATFVLLSSKVGKKVQDIPNERSLHSSPVPRVGGVGLIAGVLVAWALMFKSLAWWIVLPLMALFAISLLDDVRGLPVRQRLLVHVVAAAVLVAGAGVGGQGVFWVLLVLPAVVWMTNLYNFMDGSDGLAGGMALFGFSMYGWGALMHGDGAQAALNFSISAAALGFLFYNAHPAKVFMGDAGSIPLGFLAAAMGLWGWMCEFWPAWFPVLVFSPFIVDATVTLLKRSVRGAKVTEAHREHYYQRLVQMGWGHRKVAFSAYVLMMAAGVSAVWGLGHSADWPWGLLGAWGGIYMALMLFVDRQWKVFRNHG